MSPKQLNYIKDLSSKARPIDVVTIFEEFKGREIEHLTKEEAHYVILALQSAVGCAKLNRKYKHQSF